MDDGWRNKKQDESEAFGIAKLVQRSFGEKIGSLEFVYRNNGEKMEISIPKEKRGYEFVYPTQLDRDYQAKLNRAMDSSRNRGRTIERYFVDNRQEEQIAGFEWSVE